MGFLGAMALDILADAPGPALLIGTVVITTAAYEFFDMCRKRGMAPLVVPGSVAAALAFNLPWLTSRYPGVNDQSALLAALVIVAFVGMVCRGSRPNALTDIAVTIFGAVYIGLLGGYLVHIHLLDEGARLVVYFVVVAKVSDIGGYLAGKLAGKHKLAPTISPNKTIEGSLGGLALSVVAAFAMSFLLPKPFPAGWKVLFAVLVSIAAQFGDLCESIIKRSCGVKDSAVFLPKVCGAFDLIDSVLISAPVGFYLIAAVMQAKG